MLFQVQYPHMLDRIKKDMLVLQLLPKDLTVSLNSIYVLDNLTKNIRVWQVSLSTIGNNMSEERMSDNVSKADLGGHGRRHG